MKNVLLSLLAWPALLACSTLAPQLETPHLSIVSVEILKGDLFEQRAKVRMRVQNPNDRSLPIKGLSYVVDVAGKEFAHGDSAASFIVPALGEAEFDMNVTANMASALFRFLGSKESEGDQVEYKLRGKVALSEGLLRSIPFEETGTFKFR